MKAQVLGACGGCNGWAENIAYTYSYSTGQNIWDQWKSSPPHWANLQDARAGEFGIGTAIGSDGFMYVVMDFGRYP